jgi:hypothetical protein
MTAERQPDAAQSDTGASQGNLTLVGEDQVLAWDLLYGNLSADELAAIDAQADELPALSAEALEGVASALGLGLEPGL